MLPPDHAPAAAVVAKSSARSGVSISHDTLDGSRFHAGQVLADRYRIIDMIGRGGMGEVYRAEDLTLKQTVALKFLPEHLLTDEPALARIRQEVSVARQIAHPYVCRVYDIGEAEGQHFLCMEFIKGEELASVIKRFGRLPSDKASDIARQICSGLAAAHKQGVIHRDLKPENVMIDSEGNAKITDFGLAAVAETLHGAELRSGTPAYMSPEQLAGSPLTIKSDLYSLGLVLYEIFTGKPAFKADSVPAMLQLRKSDGTVTAPSSHVSNLDPLVERVILRCLEKDPNDRPESAIAVAAALPGGDPLAAALAMGETPSPEMVAASPKVGSLRPVVALALVAGVIASLGIIIWLSGKASLYRRAPLTNSPEVLRVKAREMSRSFGYKDGIDSADGLRQQVDFARYLKQNDPSPGRYERMLTMHPAAYVYFLRQSPDHLVPWQGPIVDLVDPPTAVSGMTRTILDMDGKLIEFVGVPPHLDTEPRATEKFDWNVLFNASGLEQARFTPAEPQWLPEVNSDTRAAWTGVAPGAPEIPIRVETASYNGRPVFFSIVYPWDDPYRQVNAAAYSDSRAASYIAIAVFLIFMFGTVMLARRNYRLGIGDHNGAMILALFCISTLTAYWALRVHHVADVFGEFLSFYRGMGNSLILSVLTYMAYIALEPLVRRRWPARIISWNRLIAKDFRDPLIGRDVLFGTLLGVASYILNLLWTLAPSLMGRPGYEFRPIDPHILLSVRGAMADISINTFYALIVSLILMFGLTLLVAVVRRDWIANTLLWIVITAILLAGGQDPLLDLPFSAAIAAGIVFCLTRLGLLAMVVYLIGNTLIAYGPYTTDFSVWYAASAVPYLALAVVLLAYGYRTATAGKSLFSSNL